MEAAARLLQSVDSSEAPTLNTSQFYSVTTALRRHLRRRVHLDLVYMSSNSGSWKWDSQPHSAASWEFFGTIREASIKLEAYGDPVSVVNQSIIFLVGVTFLLAALLAVQASYRRALRRGIFEPLQDLLKYVEGKRKTQGGGGVGSGLFWGVRGGRGLID